MNMPISGEVREPVRNALLDGLRAMAVLCVMLHHWTDWGPRFWLGQIGVQTFFVISGFLITRILLISRARAEPSKSSLLFEIRSFFVRRTLRIFPIYYLLIGTILFADRFGIRETFGWFALYASNFYFFTKGQFEGPLSHLWTLSVEEQFYLFWPWLVLFSSRRMLPTIIVILITVAPTMRFVLYETGHHEFAEYNTLVPCNLDSLGCGALLAWAHTSATVHQRALMLRAFLVVAPVVLAFSLISVAIGSALITVVSGQSTLALIVTGLLQIILTPSKYNLSFLSWTPMAYLGRISYGIYLYHMFAPNFLNVLKVPDSLKHGLVGFLIMMLITLALASLSWFVIERPINSLKSRFPYFRTQRVEAYS
jgi:peptidoglycan/LPS O-acetylase OafA/YrhL